MDQRELAAYWIDVIENSRRRKNKLAKSYKNAKPVNKFGKLWGLYGYSDDEYSDGENELEEEVTGKTKGSGEVNSASEEEEEGDPKKENGNLSIIDEPLDQENEVLGYISGISLRISTDDFSNIKQSDFQVTKLPKTLRGGQFAMRHICKATERLKFPRQ